MSHQLMTAAQTGDLKYIKSLSFKSKLFGSKTTDINVQDEHGCTALWCAARYNHVQVVKYLTQSGASVNQINQNKESPLWISSMYGLSEVVSELLHSGADPNLAKDKTTPLYAAAAKNHVRVCEMLLAQQGILVDVISSGGVTPLFAASQNGHLQVVQLLLSHGADPRIPKIDNRLTALHMAAQNGHVDVALTLLQHGADINGLTKSGKTPAHLCALVGNVEVMRLLLKHGADVNIKTDKNMRPLDFATKNSHTELVQILAECTTEEKLDEEQVQSEQEEVDTYHDLSEYAAESVKPEDHSECVDNDDKPQDPIYENVYRLPSSPAIPTKLPLARHKSSTVTQKLFISESNTIPKANSSSIVAKISQLEDKTIPQTQLEDKAIPETKFEDKAIPETKFEDVAIPETKSWNVKQKTLSSKSKTISESKSSTIMQKILKFEEKSIIEPKSSPRAQKFLTFDDRGSSDARPITQKCLTFEDKDIPEEKSTEYKQALEGEEDSHHSIKQEGRELEITAEPTGEKTSTHDLFLCSASSVEKNVDRKKMDQEESIIDAEDTEYLAARLMANLANRGRQTSLDNSCQESNENDLSDQHLMTLSMKISDFWFNIGVFLSIDCKELQQLSDRTGVTSDMAAFQMLVQWRDGFHGNLQQKKQVLRKAVSKVLEMKSRPDNVSNLLM